MSISQYSFRSGDWSSYLIDIRRSIEHGTSTYVSTSHEASGAVQASISDLQTDLNWALMLVVDRLGEQTALLTHVVAQLEAIYQTLDSPLLTQARELFRIGVDRFNRGLYGKALDSFLQAEQKDDVYFPLHLQLGLLYLSGKDNEVNLVDPIKAEKLPPSQEASIVLSSWLLPTSSSTLVISSEFIATTSAEPFSLTALTSGLCAWSEWPLISTKSDSR